MNKKRVLLTGGTGLVGTSFLHVAPTGMDIYAPSRTEMNLLNKADVEKVFGFYKPTHVVHLAARVGGLKDNMENQAEFFEQNMQITLNVLGTAAKFDCEKTVSLLSSCIYPDKIEYPIEASKLHDGPPHPSNFGYAYAKRMIDVYGRSLNQKLGRTAFITLVPNNLFGKNDSFNLDSGHFIPSLIRKFAEHKETGNPIIMWGTGNAEREFTYADDIAKLILKMLIIYDSEIPLNIGNPKNYQIKEVVDLMAKIAEVDPNQIQWDLMMPDGQQKKPTSVDLKALMWEDKDYTSLEDGLRETWKWYLSENKSRIRGLT